MSVEDAAQIFLSTPSARRATRGNSCFMGLEVFLSTPSARRATAACPEVPDGFAISIHALREEGDVCLVLLAVVVQSISIHALREEGDHRSLFRSAQKIDFYPRPPRGGRPTSSLPSWRGGNFYPRPPRGGRQAYKTDGWVGLAFLSTPSARRATWPAHRGRRQIPISIHALREEGDVARCGDSVGNRRFLSTPSARRATSSECSRTTERRYFYPRPPRGGRRSNPRW